MIGASALLLMSLSGCIATSGLWRGPLQREDTQTTTVMVPARVNDARLLQTLEDDILYVSLDVNGRPLRAFALRPQKAFVERFNETMNLVPPAQLALRVLHRPWPAEGQPEWQVQLDREQDAEPLGTRVLFHVTPIYEPPPTDGIQVTLHTVEWTVLGTTTTTTTDYGGIAWRVAVTPFAVAIDVVLAIPLAIIAGIILVTDPQFFTGG